MTGSDTRSTGGRTGGPSFRGIKDALRRARELPWSAGSQEKWRSSFHNLVEDALTSARLLLRRLASNEGDFKTPPGQILGDLIREQESLVASLEALAAEVARPRDLSTAEYVAIHERTVILESDAVRQEVRLGGSSAHDPRTVVGAACKLPGIAIGL